MDKRIIFLGSAALMLSIGAAVFAQTTVTLDQAISYGVEEIEARLEPGVKVMALNFISPSPHLSNYVLDEMMIILTRNGKLSVVEKANIDFILRELNYLKSGNINDDSARSIGRILGAQYVISGAIDESSSNYVVQFKTMAVEPTAFQTIIRVDIRNDTQIADLMGIDASDMTKADTSSNLRERRRTDTSNINEKLVLSAGGGVYGKVELLHMNPYTGSFSFTNFDTYTTAFFGAPVFFNAELFSYLLFDVSAYYLYSNSYGDSVNTISAAFSLFGQFPIQLSDRITVSPLFGVGYEMFFYAKPEDSDALKRKDLSDLDSLYLKPGVAMHYNLAGNLRLNSRFVYDFLLYSGSVTDRRKYYNSLGFKYFQFQHAPSLFLGVDYVFLKM